MPRLSIVTACYQDRAGLERTLASIRGQEFQDLEVEVVDGGSTDGTRQLLEGLGLPWVRATSEPDRGVFDAQNKGWRRARGEYCLFLNAGDWLAAPDALARVFSASPIEDLVACEHLRRWPSHLRRARLRRPLDAAFLADNSPCHAATLIRRDLLERLGGYDLAFRIAADYDFFVRALLVHRASWRVLRFPLSVFEVGGLSTRPELQDAKREERERSLASHLPPELRRALLARRGLGEAGPLPGLAARARRAAHALRDAVRRARGRLP